MVAFTRNEQDTGEDLIALASVTDKTDLPEFLSSVTEIQMEVAGRHTRILSTGWTSKLLKKSGLPVQDVSDFTGAPEMFDGRLKTLHPKVHGGFLERPWVLEDSEAAEKNGIERIGLLIVNLYNFSGAVERFNKSEKTIEDFAEVMEQIDIGGPSMLRSAAKWETTVIMNPSNYDQVLDEMRKNNGDITPSLEAELKIGVFCDTGEYDRAIAIFLQMNTELYSEYQKAKKAIIVGQREPFACWTKKH